MFLIVWCGVFGKRGMRVFSRIMTEMFWSWRCCFFTLCLAGWQLPNYFLLYPIWSFLIFALFDCNSLFLEFMSSALLNLSWSIKCCYLSKKKKNCLGHAFRFCAKLLLFPLFYFLPCCYLLWRFTCKEESFSSMLTWYFEFQVSTFLGLMFRFIFLLGVFADFIW